MALRDCPFFSLMALSLTGLLWCVPAPAAAETAQGAVDASACAACGFEPEARALEKLLKQYTELADNGGWPAWTIGKAIKAGQADARIPALRQILTITGDYQGASPSTTPLRYDEPLAAAVGRFQARHGLTADGTIGKSTQAALSVPVETRIGEIKATIERIRSRPLASEPKFILVNLPAFALYAIDHGRTTLVMRVIVGKPRSPTPLFDNAVTHVIFNPQWHVPEKIAKKEMMPKLRQDPSYFLHAGFVVTKDGEPVDPMHVSADGNADDGDFSFRQLAGQDNALGKIKFNIPDSDDIYLHSTASPRLFTKDDRALSHGCIRVERPRELAHFVMEGVKDWDGRHIDKAYDGTAERWVKVDAVPVHLVYWTAYVDAAGVPYFYNDIYRKDAATVAKAAAPVTLAAQ